jgi:hypothetical protein
MEGLMNTLEAMIYATIFAHSQQGWSDESGEWKCLCRCAWLGSNHDQHLAERIADVVTSPEAAPNGVVDGVRWTQMSLL